MICFAALGWCISVSLLLFLLLQPYREQMASEFFLHCALNTFPVPLSTLCLFLFMCILSFLAYYATALPTKLSICRPLKRCTLVMEIVKNNQEDQLRRVWEYQLPIGKLSLFPQAHQDSTPEIPFSW